MNAVEVRQWECGKSLNYIAAKQGITIRRHYRLGHGSNGTETEKDAPRNILQHIIWDKEVEVAQVFLHFRKSFCRRDFIMVMPFSLSYSINKQYLWKH